MTTIQTFTHTTEVVFIGFIGSHATRHLRGAHAWLVARVGRHSVFSERSRYQQWILQAHTAPKKQGR